MGNDVKERLTSNPTDARPQRGGAAMVEGAEALMGRLVILSIRLRYQKMRARGTGG